MTPPRRRSWSSQSCAVILALASVSPLIGCDPTEVVVVVDTDEPSTSTFDVINFQISAPDFSPPFQSSAGLDRLPVTLGVTTGREMTFNVSVTLVRGTDRMPVLTRNALNVPFTNDDERVLFVPLFQKCACTGTNCPNPTDPDCLDLTSPKTGSFDEDNLPRIPKVASP
jgi:hypothetical protein